MANGYTRLNARIVELEAIVAGLETTNAALQAKVDEYEKVLVTPPARTIVAAPNTVQVEIVDNQHIRNGSTILRLPTTPTARQGFSAVFNGSQFYFGRDGVTNLPQKVYDALVKANAVPQEETVYVPEPVAEPA